MAMVIPHDSIEDILERIFAQQKSRAEILEAQRWAVTSDPKFVQPYSQAMLLGLFSGEQPGNLLSRAATRFVNWRSRNHMILRSFYDNPSWRTNLEPPARPIVLKHYITAATTHVYESEYAFGRDLSEMDDLRNQDRSITKISRDDGRILVHMYTGGMDINDPDQERLSQRIWDRYAKGISPRLLNF